MMRNRWEMLILVLRRLTPRQRKLLAALICLLLTVPLHGFAETELLPAQMNVRTLRPPKETPEPSPTPTLGPGEDAGGQRRPGGGSAAESDAAPDPGPDAGGGRL